MENKSLKNYAKEAKMRLKRGFWQNYKETLETKIKPAPIAKWKNPRCRNTISQKLPKAYAA